MTVFQKELKHWFHTLHGILTLFVLLLCNGVALSVLNLAYGSASFSETQGTLTVALLFLLPLMCCQSIARERKSGTEAFLFSLPLSTAEIVLGKFLALAVVLAFSFVPSFLAPVLFSAFGDVSMGALYVHLFGFFMLALFLLALCFLLASLTKRPWLAYLLGLGAMLVLYFFPFFTRLTSNRLLAIEPFHRTSGFSYGHLDLASTVYFVTGIALLLLIAVCVMARRRVGLGKAVKSPLARVFAKDTLICLVTCAAIILLNVGVACLPHRLTSPKLTDSTTFDISQVTEQTLQGLTEDVTLSFLCNGGIHAAESELYAFLCAYAEACEHVTLRVIDPTQEKDRLTSYGDISALQNFSVIVESQKRYRVLDNTSLYYYYNASLGNYRISPTEYSYFCNQLAQISASELYTFVSGTDSYFDGESVLTNAILYCLQERVPILGYDASENSLLPDEHLLAAWELNGYDCIPVSDLNAITACDVLLLNSPRTDLTQAQSDAIKAYLDRGGKLFLTTSYSNVSSLTNLQALLSAYGMAAPTDTHLVCEGQQAYCYQASTPNLFYAHVSSDTPMTGDFNGLFIVPNAHAIELTPTDGITQTAWLYTSAASYLGDPSTGKALSETRASYTVGAFAQTVNGGGILWISAPYAVFSEADSYVSGANFTLLTNATNALTNHVRASLHLSADRMELARITVSNQALAIWSLILCAALPLSVLVIGTVRIYVRKKR